MLLQQLFGQFYRRLFNLAQTGLPIEVKLELDEQQGIEETGELNNESDEKNSILQYRMIRNTHSIVPRSSVINICQNCNMNKNCLSLKENVLLFLIAKYKKTKHTVNIIWSCSARKKSPTYTNYSPTENYTACAFWK